MKNYLFSNLDLKRLIIPLIIEQILAVTVGMVDTMMISSAGVLILMPLILKLYGLSDETLHLAAILVLIHNGMGILLWPTSFTLTGVLRAANDVKFPMAVSISSMLFLRVLFSYILAKYFQMGAIGVWIAMVADWIVRTSFFVTRFRSGKWKKFYKGNPA